MAVISNLRRAYESDKLLLFVGAGVSMPLGLPSWDMLIGQMADELGYDSEVFRTYGNDLALAEYHRLKSKDAGQFMRWMDDAWHSGEVDISSSEAHRLIAQSKLDLIYTTNYDRWLERSFDHYGRKYKKITSAADIAGADRSSPQIVKFHGDFDDPKSIVLDESSYYNRLRYDSPLDIKLRSDILGKSILFIGYSLSDLNVRYMLHQLAGLWRDSADASAQPTSYLFSHKPNPVQRAVLGQWRIEMISSTEDDPEKALTILLREVLS